MINRLRLISCMFWMACSNDQSSKTNHGGWLSGCGVAPCLRARAVRCWGNMPAGRDASELKRGAPVTPLIFWALISRRIFISVGVGRSNSDLIVRRLQWALRSIAYESKKFTLVCDCFQWLLHRRRHHPASTYWMAALNPCRLLRDSLWPS